MYNRVPTLANNSHQAMSQWFSDMADASLIFHPEDKASTIECISDGAPFFSPAEAERAQAIIDEFFTQFGDSAVNDAAYPHFMRAAGFPAH